VPPLLFRKNQKIGGGASHRHLSFGFWDKTFAGFGFQSTNGNTFVNWYYVLNKTYIAIAKQVLLRT
jgi:hypothetical protein